MADIREHVRQHKARHKWLAGGVEFVDAIPKTPSGKIQRRLLRDRERVERQVLASAPKNRQPRAGLPAHWRGMFPSPWKLIQALLPTWSTQLSAHIGLGESKAW